MKTIYAYYESNTTAHQAEEFACSNWWKTSWQARGWEPVMLNRSHAQGSNLHSKLMQRILGAANGVPAIAARIQFITARFARWCALHAAGGGWMSDYDVFNTSFKPEVAEEYEKVDTLQINTGEPAYLFYATRHHAENAIKKFLQDPLFDGEKVLPEAQVLGVLSGLYPILPLVKHAKSKDGIPRSAIMQSLNME